MYYPILRGRQNELLAIRELSKAEKLKHIIPIIEPVKVSSTLFSTIMQLEEANNPAIIVLNSDIGSFEYELTQSEEVLDDFYETIYSADNLSIVFRNGRGLFEPADFPGKKIGYFLSTGNTRLYRDLCDAHMPAITLISNPRLRRIAKGRKISLTTEFDPLSPNAKYRHHPKDFLTEEHLFFRDEGFDGFSDYSIIGEDYSEGGFMPRVVALHLTYFNSEDDALFIRHFTSGDGFGEHDVAGKFSDALSKMMKWVFDNKAQVRYTHTRGLDIYRNTWESGHYPGLGVAKKLSLMHHIETMNYYLEESHGFN